MGFIIAILALIIERGFGYPKFLQERIGHPVQWMGALIVRLDGRWNRADLSERQRRGAGLLMLIVLIGATGVTTLILASFLNALPMGWLVEAIIASAFLSQRQLAQSVRAVAEGLALSLPTGRQAVSHIVGRDSEQLDNAGVARAAIETLAENASDGIVAPLFWLLFLGLPGIAIYKAINTADSMVGYLNENYADFGRASAKLDDLVNWLPARLTAGLFALAAIFLPGATPGKAWRTALRDGPKHKSPNAGWPEAALAGALGFRLGGARTYNNVLVDLLEMGDGNPELNETDIEKALMLFARMGGLLFALGGFATLLIFVSI